MAETVETTQEETEKQPPFCRVEGDDESVLSFIFRDNRRLDCDLGDLSDEMQNNLLVHGLTQKGRDSFASAKGDIDFAYAAVSKVWDNLKADQWNASRASGTSEPRSTELAQAIADIKGLDLAAVVEAVANAPDEKRKAWRKNPAVKARIMEIRAEKAKARLEASKTAGESLEIDGL